MKKYYSKHDKEFIGLYFIIVLLPCLIMPMIFPQWIQFILLIDAIIIAYSIKMWYTVWYSIGEDGLVVSMHGRKNILKYKDIVKLELVTKGGRPCLGFSKDRIKIKFKNGDYLYISPKAREEVYKVLRTKCFQ